MSRVAVLTMQVDVADLPGVVGQVAEWAREEQPTAGHYVCVSNVHMCMETRDSIEFRQVVNGASLVVADGKPIQVAQRLLGAAQAGQVRGMDLTLALCAKASADGIPVGFYGASEAILDEMCAALEKTYPDLAISYRYSPPFRPLTPEEDAAICQSVIASGARILFVGLGCPKQERWMADHVSRLPVVMLGVGAAFDFIAGRKQHAPRWMQALAMEWVFRLLSEPRRLWRRYFKHNPRFVYYLAGQLLSGRR